MRVKFLLTLVTSLQIQKYARTLELPTKYILTLEIVKAIHGKQYRYSRNLGLC